MGLDCFILTTNNYRDFQIAFGKIFWMYHDMVTSYGGFGHGVDFEHIEYERFFFATSDKAMEGIYTEQLEIVRQGAFVALCCEVVDLLDEARRDKKVIQFISAALANPEIEKLSFEKEILVVMKEILAEEPSNFWEENSSYSSKFLDLLKEIYKRYVLGYYKSLLKDEF